ncbi:AraC family transcriptional regulator [Pseudomonas syringae pv. antirrhini]|uniref:AraC family transcriptional regulator n=1 Tax=Pseudomonas syringae pv. antirrhini TaxID=251702 RepID=A0A0P9JW39_9PSED|nr:MULTISPECIES: AraC family transcriptional regulator [Pseudomonas]KPW46453.1 AraC family transcriptional regulator [Pseudomonas syringae pv. antirrhini]RMP40701.1 AraC family transcriptional regulator [Pseudomonas syringae pv. antirrhini]RMW24809.1 AraC family transcriptional regulator [Pseudomonas syringae pv. antirrhini]WIN08028.1 AraC family transcriptional regulator [Pseudomonas syringae pv. antirrhini str. 126]
MTRNQTFSVDIGWKALLKDFGIQPSHVLRRAGLPEDLFSREGHGLTTEEYFRFWRSLEAEAGDVMFPLRIVETVSVESFDPPLFAALCSTNLMQAVQRLAKYKQLLAPMSLEVEVGNGGELTVLPRWLTVQMQVPFSLQVAEIAFYVRLARLATREPVKALRVALPELPPSAYSRRYEKFFGVPVQQGTAPSITFSAADMLRPFLTVNAGMWRVFEPDLRRRLSELDATSTTAERVRAVLLELLPSNAATIEKAAERLGMSKRTLQRRLEDEGENFRAMVNATRENLARHYLTNTKMSGGEIAFLLGFEDPNSFYRAFQDWTGQTPDSARNAMHLN